MINPSECCENLFENPIWTSENPCENPMWKSSETYYTLSYNVGAPSYKMLYKPIQLDL